MKHRHFSRFNPRDSFVDQLAAYVLERCDKAPETLARCLIFLPSRRSCRNLREAFLRVSDGRPLLLPRMLALGDIDEESDITAFSSANDELLVLDNKQRAFMLTKLILTLDKGLTPARAFTLAESLGALLDDITRYDLDIAKLSQLVPDNLAKHWQQTLDFLQIVTRHWPRILHEYQAIEPAKQQRDRILALAKHWQENPPDYTVIAAGSTGSIPATTTLLDTIASLDSGEVILPDFDPDMPSELWDTLDPTHPHYAIKLLLNKARTPRHEVRLISRRSSQANATLRQIFAPAQLTMQWKNIDLDIANDMTHIALAEAATQSDEARMIALAMRSQLDTPAATAALITPDRNLARKVAAQLARYGVEVDDSAGVPLNRTPACVFLRLILQLFETDFSPKALLALLRHPLAAIAGDALKTREYSRILERELLRGVRPSGGIATLQTMALQRPKTNNTDFLAWLEQLAQALRPMEILWLNNNIYDLETLLATHVSVAEAIALPELWSKDSGNQLAQALGQWRAHTQSMDTIKSHHYPALFEAMVAGEVSRPRYGLHPRLQILSPIEARLCHFDLTILGGLNEGVWPAPDHADPWMSIPMREAFGLPKAGFGMGQSAHDVWVALQGKKLLLTRARKVVGKPTIASRWWVRLCAVVQGKAPEMIQRINRSIYYEAMIRAQDAPLSIPAISCPSVSPPIALRPRSFSPTSFILLQADPYAFYARYVLKLKPLPPLDEEPDAADFGSYVHEVLERFITRYPDQLPEHSYQQLIQEGRGVFQSVLDRPALHMIWWPKFEAIARMFLEKEKSLRVMSYSSLCETLSKSHFDIAGTPITLSAKADRLDISEQGVRLIDYKTGSLATAKAIVEGKAPQLPLTALSIMQGDAALRLHSKIINSLAYMGLSGRGEAEWVEVDCSDELLVRYTVAFEQTITAMFEADYTFTASYKSASAEAYDDFAHLTRRAEWWGGGD